ncbi:NDP-hexose 2,3-dehydratase family protein [Amycolatopsis cihanbeyliensis]|uniref:Oxidase EvaA n=1 Tax=Amycolatopsis cihanbeyliensis TaxID=1128664 RepID=A0A542DBF3_AMYCI|nr:NDP-hexose 2,3-dehydratase family protein [Amycolatopsis cihanbeyliensis]TQJ00401.1 oxidase EvaA [Amycolatopsis cihanbeyliensis]
MIELASLARHPTLAARLAASASATDGAVWDDARVRRWLEDRRREHRQRVRLVPLDEMRGWHFRPGLGDLRHRSGRFYSVQGLHVSTDTGPVPVWSQPIINQPEIGILGIVVREIDGLLHCLVQAKTEPGNVNGIQLSPTVQATRSNYTRAHGGSAVPYLEYFRSSGAGTRTILADVLQSEQGAWFYCKRNRNMIVEVGPEVEAREDFCWLTLRQLNRLLAVDNLVNMDTRTVLSCMPGWHPPEQDDRRGAHTDVEIRSWITEQQSEHTVTARLMPLPSVHEGGWRVRPDRITHRDGRYFDIIGAEVDSNTREVPSWCQPLLRPHGTGIAALLVRYHHGTPHALVNASVEAGYRDVVELGPTVQCTPENYTQFGPEHQPRYLDLVRSAPPESVLFDSVLSEEGGRFYHATTRYLIVDAGEELPLATPPEFRWMSLPQLTEFLKYSHYVNVQARTLIAALRSVLDRT